MTATALLDLAKAGFTDEQVRALAAYFDSQMATKADIAELRRDIEQVRADLTAELARIRADLDLKIAGVDLKIAAVDLKVVGVELKIAESKAEIIKWVVGWVAGLLVAQGAAVIALIRLVLGAHP